MIIIINRKKAGFGVLPKHKDYAEKAKAKNSATKQIKKLQRAAAMRNPDEFYFKMENSHISVCHRIFPHSVIFI